MALEALQLRSTLDGLSPAERSKALFVPALEQAPMALADLLSLLPVVDINGALAAALAQRRFRPEEAPVAAVFCVDPFLRVADMAQIIAAAGVRQVANYPSVQLIDGETGHALAAVGYGPENELATLLRFRASGLDIVGCASTPAWAERLAEAGIAEIVMTPPLGSGEGVFRRL